MGDMATNSLEIGTCEFQDLDPVTKDFIISWKINAHNKEIYTMTVNRSYKDFSKLHRDLNECGVGNLPELPKMMDGFQTLSEHEIYYEMRQYLTEIMARQDIINLLTLMKFITSDNEIDSSVNRSDSLNSSDSRT